MKILHEAGELVRASHPDIDLRAERSFSTPNKYSDRMMFMDGSGKYAFGDMSNGFNAN